MSRIAKQPVNLSVGISWWQDGSTVTVKSTKTELKAHIPARQVTISETDGMLQVKPKSAEPADRAAAGLTRNLLKNLVHGVTEDFIKELEFSGVGYRVNVEGQMLTLMVGYSHPVKLAIPEGVTVAVQKHIIRISGPDLQAVGQFAANVRAVRLPEPYKGKGIHYVGEHIRRKAGKAGKATE